MSYRLGRRRVSDRLEPMLGWDSFVCVAQYRVRDLMLCVSLSMVLQAFRLTRDCAPLPRVILVTHW